MISTQTFCNGLAERGYSFFTGVPCSSLAGPVEELARVPGRYFPAANEGAALAMAAGAYLAGRRPAVLIQNSGLGNLLNPLTSLLLPYRIPALMFISLRGWPDAGADEPQHEAMGMATHRILSDCGVPYWLLKDDEIQLQEILKKVDAIHKKGSPAAVLVPGGVLAPAAARSQGQPGTDGWGRRQAIQALLPHLEGCAIFSTTGYISRDLFAAADRELNFYMQGSMGHALALGLGVAISQPQRRVVVLDGDGAVLMHMGTTATVGAIAPENLVHVVIDNGVYESTGGQPTMARSLCWTCLGSAARYRSTKQVSSAGETDSAMPAIMAVPGPHLIVVTVDIGGKVPPRATAAISPEFFHARIRCALADGKPPSWNHS